MPEHGPQEDPAREDLSRCLAACYYEPDADFTEDRLFESMLEAARRIDPQLADSARKLGSAFAAENLEALSADYTRLFLDPVRPLAGAHGSFWLGEETTLALLELYGEAGFEFEEDSDAPPDHITLELEFLYVLTLKQNEARVAGYDEVVAAWELLRGMLLREHLGAWIGRFAAAVKSGAQTAFYRELADLTERFVRMETQASKPAPH